VARISQQSRLEHIAATGAETFGRLGYRRARMADVAASAGLSAGAIYTYVESKEALFHLVLLSLLEAVPDSADGLPLVAPPFAETLAMMDSQLRTLATVPALQAAARRRTPADVRAELAEIVAEHYAMIQRLWPALAVIERCAVDLPELHEFYFQRRRRDHLSTSGHFAPFTDTRVAAQLAIESIVWFAWHRLQGFDAGEFDQAEAGRQTVIEFVCNALIGPHASTR
jgi:AcrR family transcriptional regulator